MARPRFHRPPTAQEAVLKELRELLLSGELAPGQQIVQEALADELGVSRVPIREALRVLEAEGQVVYEPHRGYFVTSLSLDELLEIYRIRSVLEAEAARAAVRRLTDADVARMADALEAVEQASTAENLTEMASANRIFHFTLLDAAGLPRLVRIVRQLWDATDAYRSRYYSAPEHREAVRAEHRAILAAVQARDADALVSLLDQHRDHAVAALRQALSG